MSFFRKKDKDEPPTEAELGKQEGAPQEPPADQPASDEPMVRTVYDQEKDEPPESTDEELKAMEGDTPPDKL